MRPRRFGATGMAVSPIGLGTVKFGRNTAVRYPRSFDLPDDAAAANLLSVAQDLGINFLDTAPAYGTSEERLGTLLRGQRHRWLICTKVGEEFDVSSATSRFDFSPEHVRRSVERSLRRLATDVLDIVLVHSDGDDIAIVERFGTLQALADLKAQGKLRAFGISSKTVEGGLSALEQCDCAMVTYNRENAVERPVLDRALELNRGILVKKPLGSGHIVATADDRTVEESLRFVFGHPAVHSAVIGTINPDHLKANVEAFRRIIAATR